MDYREALAYLDRHTNHEARAGHIEGLSLEPMRALLDVLAQPQRAYRVIHLTGTNGKGTVAHFASGLLAASGLHAGTYTSPHLIDVTERLRSNGDPIGEDEFGRVIGDIAALAPLSDTEPTYFEILTAAAFGWFAEIAVDVAVVEVGLLGRFDATNTVDGDVSVVTSIGRDHTDGHTGWQLDIASEKAGIVRPGRPLVVGELDDVLLAPFLAESPDPVVRVGENLLVGACLQAVGGQIADLSTPRAGHEEVFVPLFGDHQVVNAALAVAAVEELIDAPLDDELITEGLANAPVRGRFEVVHRQPTVVVDGAHNPPAAEALCDTLTDVLGEGRRRFFVLGMLAPREVDEMLGALRIGDGDVVIATRAPSERAIEPAAIGEAAGALGADTETIADPEEATVRAITIAGPDDVVVVCGTFYLYAAATDITSQLAPEY